MAGMILISSSVPRWAWYWYPPMLQGWLLISSIVPMWAWYWYPLVFQGELLWAWYWYTPVLQVWHDTDILHCYKLTWYWYPSLLQGWHNTDILHCHKAGMILMSTIVTRLAWYWYPPVLQGWHDTDIIPCYKAGMILCTMEGKVPWLPIVVIIDFVINGKVGHGCVAGWLDGCRSEEAVTQTN